MGFMERTYSRGKSFSFGKTGDKIVGTIIEIDDEARTMADDRGDVHDATVLTIAADAERSVSHDRDREPITIDDGQEFTVWLPVNRRALCQAVKDAVVKSGAKTIDIGARIAVQYTANGEQKDRSKTAPKLFSAEYSAPVRNVSADSIL